MVIHMENYELLHMIIPYAVSITVFLVLGIVFFIKDSIFNYIDKKRLDLWQRKYGVSALAERPSYRIKQVKSPEEEEESA